MAILYWVRVNDVPFYDWFNVEAPFLAESFEPLDRWVEFETLEEFEAFMAGEIERSDLPDETKARLVDGVHEYVDWLRQDTRNRQSTLKLLPGYRAPLPEPDPDALVSLDELLADQDSGDKN